MSVTTILGAAAALLCGALSGCSFILDSSTKQCSVDTDCDSFGNHPKCMSNVCVDSGLGPANCFFPTADKPLSKQADFLNQCTTSTHQEFNNCDRLTFGCNGGPTTLPPQTTPPMTMPQGSNTAPTPPSNLCTDNAPTSGGTPNMIWLFGSSDFGPLMRAAQPSLSAAATPYRAVFQNASSCAGVTAIFSNLSGATDPTKRLMKDPADPAKGGWAFYFDDNGNQVNCRIDPMGTSVGVPITIGISDLYSTTCGFTPTSTTVTEYTGPVVPFVFATKAASKEVSISAEAAHMVFANGGMPPSGSGMKPAMPWIDYTKYYIRNTTAGSTVLSALLLNVKISTTNPFWGIDRVSTDNLRDALLAATDPDAAIGILSIDFYDKNRGNLKGLYLQSFNQSAGYLPDSKPTTTDKMNVRDGHYPLWGYVHFVVPLDSIGGTSQAANAMTLLFSVDKLDQRLVDAIIAASEVPQCAMKVQRRGELNSADGSGDFKVRTGFSCGCYFDAKTTNHSDCKTCSTSDECPNGGSCNYGYCEAN
ncbi:MAG TPA: hypothetical protein VF516_09350 [Kofleriaceae bacterium]